MNVLFQIISVILTLVFCVQPMENSPELPIQHVQFRRTSFLIKNDQVKVNFSSLENIWYADSIGITEICYIRTLQRENWDSTFSATVGYRFVDMRKKWAYEYRSLSDTAAIIQKYSQDTFPVIVYGGYNFYRTAVIQFDSLYKMPDTVINGTGYGRHRYIQRYQGKKMLGEVLTSCDRIGSIFQLDVGLSKAIGCPMMIGRSLTLDGRFPTSSVAIEFVSKKIPDSIKVIFAAWKKNEKLHPVK